MSTATIPVTTTDVGQHARAARPTYAPIPMRTIMGVELRKMFNTRSGFWLMASVVILAVIATGAVILFAPDADITYDSFAGAIGIPMTIVLPIIAALSITSEWSQRTGLTTFTMVPSRGRVVLAKLFDTVLIGVVSILVALAVGVVGNVVGSQLAGVPTTWDLGASEVLYILGGHTLGLLMGPAGRCAGVVRRRAALGGLPVQPVEPVRRRPLGHQLGPARRHRRRVAAAPPGLRPLAGAAVRGEVTGRSS